MPSIRKSASSRQNIIPYIRSASSKLSLTALSSTSSLSALFSSASLSVSSSSKSIFMSGIRGIVSGKDNDKENTSPARSPSSSKLNTRSKSPKDRSKKRARDGTYPEISAPQMTADSLEAVRAKFTLVPLKKVEPCADDSDMVIVTSVDYRDASATQIGSRF